MEKKIFTELSETEVRQLFREELEKVLSNQQPTSQEKAKQFFKLKEACQYLGISTSTMYKHTSKGKIPHSKRGKFIYFDKAELDAWVLSQKVKTVAEMEGEINDFLNNNRK